MATKVTERKDHHGHVHGYTVELESGRQYGVMVGADWRPWLIRAVEGTGGWLERGKIWQSRAGRRPLPGPSSIAGRCVAAVREAFPVVREPL